MEEQAPPSPHLTSLMVMHNQQQTYQLPVILRRGRNRSSAASPRSTDSCQLSSCRSHQARSGQHSHHSGGSLLGQLTTSRRFLCHSLPLYPVTRAVPAPTPQTGRRRGSACLWRGTAGHRTCATPGHCRRRRRSVAIAAFKRIYGMIESACTAGRLRPTRGGFGVNRFRRCCRTAASARNPNQAG